MCWVSGRILFLCDLNLSLIYEERGPQTSPIGHPKIVFPVCRPTGYLSFFFFFFPFLYFQLSFQLEFSLLTGEQVGKEGVFSYFYLGCK